MFGTKNLEFLVIIIVGVLLAAYSYYNVNINRVFRSYKLINAGLWISQMLVYLCLLQTVHSLKQDILGFLN